MLYEVITLGDTETEELERVLAELDGEGVRCLVVNLAVGLAADGMPQDETRGFPQRNNFV